MCLIAVWISVIEFIWANSNWSIIQRARQFTMFRILNVPNSEWCILFGERTTIVLAIHLNTLIQTKSLDLEPITDGYSQGYGRMPESLGHMPESSLIKRSHILSPVSLPVAYSQPWLCLHSQSKQQTENGADKSKSMFAGDWCAAAGGRVIHCFYQTGSQKLFYLIFT